MEIDTAILDRAAQPMPTELGTIDAIHLATALLWKEMALRRKICARPIGRSYSVHIKKTHRRKEYL